MNPLRQAVIDRIWRGDDPLRYVPTNLIEFDLQGWNSQHPYLREAILDGRPSIAVEIGVWKGGSTVFMADCMKQAGMAGVVIAVDTWLGSSEHWLIDDFRRQMSFMNGYPALYHKFAANVLRAGVGDHVVPLPIDSLNAAQLLRGTGVLPALIHLDGGHDYDSVTADLKVWWNLLMPGGLLIGDDYFDDGKWPTVRQAFDDFFAAQNHLGLEHSDGKCRLRKPN